MSHRALVHAVLSFGSLGLIAGCSAKGGPSPDSNPSPPPSATAASTSTAASTATEPVPVAPGAPMAIPLPSAMVAKELNAKNFPPYTGPTGTLRGTVRIEGDAPPDVPGLKIPPECAEASATYGKLFRVGTGKALADAMVTVVGYTGVFVPAKGDAVLTTIHGCAFNKRTLVATFGQRVDVQNLDPIKPYMVFLDGAPTKAIMAAIPGGSPIKLYPMQAGAHYMLRDQLPNPFLKEDVYVLKYPTHDVTGLDGHYEIKDIPVGKMHVSAILPAIQKTVSQPFEIKAGDNTLDLTLTFSKKDFDNAKPSASAKPPASPPSGPN